MRLRTTVVLLLCSILQTTYCNPDAPVHCSGLEDVWPRDLDPQDITLQPNLEEDTHVYSLTSEDSNQHPGPGEEVTLKLSSEDGLSFYRFLISVHEEDEDLGCGAGRLQSSGDTSEPVSYNCPVHLQEKVPSNVTSIEFNWTAPNCGCVQITAEVLDEENNMFTSLDDPNHKLKYTLCVTNLTDDTIDLDDMIDDITTLDNIVEDLTALNNTDPVLEAVVEDYVDDNQNDVGGVKQAKKRLVKAVKMKEKIKRKALRRQRNKAMRRLNKVPGKKWCCKQGKSNFKKLGTQTCGDKTPEQVLEFALFKFGIGKNVCNNQFTRCCANGKLRRKSLNGKIKNLKNKRNLKKMLKKLNKQKQQKQKKQNKE